MLRWHNGNLQTDETGDWVTVPVVIDPTQKEAEMCASCGSWVDNINAHTCWVKEANG